MKKNRIPLIATVLALFAASLGTVNGQHYDPLHAPNTYRQADNPNYWKNKMPEPGYWQQDVHYTIAADIDEQENTITATQKLEYWNNSPDTLTFVYFHLYQNAFQPGSHYSKLTEANKRKVNYGSYESRGLGQEILLMLVNGKEAKTELDNTILKVYLPEPLLPGESTEFDTKFKTYFDMGSMRRRMKMFYVKSYAMREDSSRYLTRYKHFDGVHWYPRISVYDRKFGWTTDQHLSREFYGDFGTYDVALTFSDNYVVDATGNMVNRKEMLPEELRAKLDVSNFKDKPWNEPANDIIPYDHDKRKTWVFHAENVHDFAFTADPTYRIAEAEWNGVRCIGLAQEPHASKWQNSAEYTAKIIRVFSEDIGRYTYHKMIVADARDGMEYPMLTLDGGGDPTYHGLLVHEVGHNWFYGQIGNNETYRAGLDEGFTQFLTAWGIKKIDGETWIRNPIKNKYKAKHTKPLNYQYTRNYMRYLNDARKDRDPQLNTHSDDFGGALRHGGGYSHVYFKTAVMLWNLQYVLGDELYLNAMKNYFAEWKIAHPYMNDFRNSVIHYTKVDLNWFFDQWWETTKNIDYRIDRIRKTGRENEYSITFKRVGTMQMPLDFQVVSKTGGTFDYHIPNTWFVKKTKAEVLPRWIGWGKLSPTYEATITVPGGLDDVIIDPTDRLADIYQLDNRKKFKSTLQFDHQISNQPAWRNYELKWRPDVWYNSYDGIKAGLHLNGNYLGDLRKFSLTAWYNTGVAQGGVDNLEYPGAEDAYNIFSYSFKYSTYLRRGYQGPILSLAAKYLDGAEIYRIGLRKDLPRSRTVFARFKSMRRPTSFDLAYSLYPGDPFYANPWQPGLFVNTLQVGMRKNIKHWNGRTRVEGSVKTPAPGSDYDYSFVDLEAVNYKTAGKLDVRTRVYARYGSGSNVPGAGALYLAGGSPEDLLNSKYTRSAGIIPSAWTGYGVTTQNFHQSGGLNLRGYAGYLTAQEDGDTVYSPYAGHSGAAVNIEVEFDRLFRFRPTFTRKWLGFDSYFFGDAGMIGYERVNGTNALADLRFDAGVGFALTIKKWWVLDDPRPLTIRFDVPVVLSHTPNTHPDFIINGDNQDTRWKIGIGRAF